MLASLMLMSWLRYRVPGCVRLSGVGERGGGGGRWGSVGSGQTTAVKTRINSTITLPSWLSQAKPKQSPLSRQETCPAHARCL